MPVLNFGAHTPQLAPSAFVAPDAWVIGQTTVAHNVSIFFGAVLRGDINPILLGENTNIQEHALLHTSTGLGPCRVGRQVVVGHRAILHGCTVEDDCTIGMGATILDGAIIGAGSIVGAQALIPQNMIVPPRSLVLGVPAKVVRVISEAEVNATRENALHYVTLGQAYKKLL